MASTRPFKTNRWLSASATPFVAVALCLVAQVGTAATAHADVADDKFLALLRSDDIEHESAAAAIAAGHKVCDYLDSGMTTNEVAKDIENSSNGALPDYDAGFFIGAAIKAYCPRDMPPPQPAGNPAPPPQP